MQILILLGFVLALTSVSPEMVRTLPGASALTGGLAAVYLLEVVVLARLGVITIRRALTATSSTGAGRRYRRISQVERLWLLVGSAGLLAGGYADWVSSGLGLQNVPLLAAWAAVAPFVAAMTLSWLVGYPAHRDVRLQVCDARVLGEPPLRTWTRRQYVLFQIRTHLLMIGVPLSLIVLAQDVLQFYVRPALDPHVAEYLIPLAMISMAVMVLVTAPLLIRRVWSTEPLPAGAMRTELTALCDRLGLHRRDILLWRSHGVLANAAVMGLMRPVRYVLLSDALLERMERRQILAVCAHEAGHVVGHHMVYIGLFALATAGLAGAAAEAVYAISRLPAWAIEALFLTVMAPVWVFGFGWLSRRLERQCDVAAAWVMGKLSADGADLDADWNDSTVTPRGAAVLASALERVADLNGMPVHQSNWRHGSIAWRVNHILALSAGGGSRREIDRLVRRIKRGLWLAFVVAVGANIALMILLENTP